MTSIFGSRHTYVFGTRSSRFSPNHGTYSHALPMEEGYTSQVSRGFGMGFGFGSGLRYRSPYFYRMHPWVRVPTQPDAEFSLENDLSLPEFVGDTYPSPRTSYRDLTDGSRARTLTISIVGGLKKVSEGEYVYHLQVGDSEFLVKTNSGFINEEVTVVAPEENEKLYIAVEGKEIGLWDTEYYGDEDKVATDLGTHASIPLMNGNEEIGEMVFDVTQPTNELKSSYVPELVLKQDTGTAVPEVDRAKN